MPAGPGKYDDECTAIRQAEEADAVMVIVVGGKNKGSGFSMQVAQPGAAAFLPHVLRRVADQIEHDGI